MPRQLSRRAAYRDQSQLKETHATGSRVGMAESSKLYETRIPAIGHRASGCLCLLELSLALIQCFLTTLIPPFWNGNIYYVLLDVGFVLVCLCNCFQRGITVKGLLWVSEEMFKGLWTFKQCRLLRTMETFKVELNACFHHEMAVSQ